MRALSVSALTALAALSCVVARAEPGSGQRAPRLAETAARPILGDVAKQTELDSCYRQHAASLCRPSINTLARFFSRGRKIIFADIDLEEAPALASCLERTIETWLVPIGADRGPSDALGSGMLSIVVGPPGSERGRTPTTPHANTERLQTMVREALARGVLRESDQLVQELQKPHEPWPTAMHQKQMAACYEAASQEYPAVIVHKQVTILVRERRVLAADLQVPEAPALERCLLDKIVTWRAPLNTSQAVLTSFNIDLGAPPAWPQGEGDRGAHFARRNGLIARAVKAGLISEAEANQWRVPSGAASDLEREP